MKKLSLIIMLLVPMALSGCASRGGSAAAGALGGAAAGGGAYEYRLHREMQRVEEEYKAGRIKEDEYKIRKDQIQRMRLLD